MHPEFPSAALGRLVRSEDVRRIRTGIAISLAAVVMTGCQRADEIQRYQVPKSRSSKTSPSKADDVGFTFETPETWETGQRVVSRGGITIAYEAAFTVTDGDKRLDISVSRMPTGGSSLMNVNRWRTQVGLGPIEADQFDRSVEAIEIGGSAAKYVELVGSEESILGAIAVRGRESWYFKLKGANELANREKENFQAFLKSIRFK